MSGVRITNNFYNLRGYKSKGYCWLMLSTVLHPHQKQMSKQGTYYLKKNTKSNQSTYRIVLFHFQFIPDTKTITKRATRT